MADHNSPDYKFLYLQTEERRRQAEDEGRQEKERRERAEEEGRQEKERRERAEEEGRQEKERRERAEERRERAEERRERAEERRERAEEEGRQEKERRERAEEEGRQEKERRERAEEEGRQEKERRERAEEEGRQEKERRERAEEEGRQEKERRERAEERTQPTTFVDFLRLSHNLLSRPLRVETPSRSTRGKVPLPTGKYCPTRLEHWTDCSEQQSVLYRTVCSFLQLVPGGAPRLFSSLQELEGLAQQFSYTPISSEQELEAYERLAVEKHVYHIIAELCKIPAACEEFGLGHGIRLSNHTNSLTENTAIETDTSQPSSTYHPRPDQIYIHRADGITETILTTVEYKPPHKLPVAALRTGLRPMNLWNDLVRSNKIPTNQEAKLRYNAARLSCSALVQEYHVMIQEGLEFSYVTNGIARVLLRVPYDNPSTLEYFLCDPNSEIISEDGDFFQQPRTSVARTLCLCLMAFRSPIRDQEWRNSVRPRLRTWETSFNHARSQLSNTELEQIAIHSDSTTMDFPSPESGSSYALPSSSPDSPTTDGRRVPTRSYATCAPPNEQHRSQSPELSDSDPNHATGRKRGFSQVMSSPSARQATGRSESSQYQCNQSQRHNAQFCTQQCLLGLQTGGILDDRCPNVTLHRQGGDTFKHLIKSEDLVNLIKAELDENIDRCIPFGRRGSYGAPFKLTCAAYGYTVIGKGTTSGLWKEVSGEAQVYHILRKVQGAGEIRHMLLMGWGGESISTMELSPLLREEIRKSCKEIRSLGIIHEDFRHDNVLWNEELGRALIIDFHRISLRNRPNRHRLQNSKRRHCGTEAKPTKRLRVP
ncbi:Protein kinase-like domain [Penicillium digitatum]|uniref:Protein kinase-like domain n=1 Tax=Penicillium digitatum TaxID=36651 RepID=A0A7T6XG61_PENDI|nr:Protein kinase-like domain [Penicillium digitatum]